MATAVDPVRNTLDTLALDPAAKADRPYLESMLRRLGYSEVEIKQFLGDAPAPVTKAAAPVAAPPSTEDRTIDIEYTGPGLREFKFVEVVSEEEFNALGAGLNAGEEVIDGGPSMEEVDRLMAEGDVDDDFGEFEAQKQEAVAEFKGFDEEGGEGMTSSGDINLDAPPGEGGSDFGGEAPKLDEPVPEGGEAVPTEADQAAVAEAGDAWGAVEEAPAEEELVEFLIGTPLVEFQEIHAHPAIIGPAASGAPGELEVYPGSEGDSNWEDGDALAGTGGKRRRGKGDGLEVYPGTGSGNDPIAPQDVAGRWPGEPGSRYGGEPVGEEGPFRHGDWTLYSRDVEMGDGKAQRIYFFSKGDPQNGSPATMPEGYEVAENDRTGLPYLRRIDPEAMAEPVSIDQIEGDGSAPTARRKRVRIARVQAGSKEAAERKVAAAAADRKVLSSMPIDIEEI